MKRSLQEIIELVAFGLIALLIATGIIWVVGWLLGLVGVLFQIIAGFLWAILRYLIPIAIIAAAVYFLVKLIQNRNKKPATPSQGSSSDKS